MTVVLLIGTFALHKSSVPGGEQNEPLIRALELILDPGSFNGSDENSFSLVVQLLVTLTGAVFFTAMLITVLGNIVGNRIENYKKGRVRYRFDNHVLVLGANSMLVNMLREFIQTGVHQDRKIVVLTTQDTEKLHDKVLSDVPEMEDKLDVTWLNGSRIIDQTLRNVQVDDAYSIYILGEDDEIDHDSINLECWKRVKDVCKDVRRPVQCYLVVDRVSTYHVLQFGKKEKDTWLYLNIINSLENWAQRVLVSREYEADCSVEPEQCRFPAIDRDGIMADSDKTVRFVIWGMTQMSYAMASTVAHIAHFPNFRNGQNRTKICFIAPDIREEMDFFLGHYDNLFRLSNADYIHWDQNGEPVIERLRTPLAKYGDFLDIEWVFVDGSVESDNIRSLLHEWACNDKEYLSIALCENESDANVAASLYLPEAIYANKVPVFVYQPLSGEVLKYAHKTPRYSNVYPFGMKDECYDPLFCKRIVKAKRINYLYQLQDNGISYEKMAESEVLEDYWNTRSEYLFKLSNLYASNSIPIKLRSIGIDPDKVDCKTVLSPSDISILSEVEHNRWNMERLLLGTQPLYVSKRKAINDMLKDSDPEVVNQGKAINKHLKNNFYHKDIAPYDELLPSSKQYDTAIVTNILDVIKDI
ncbi:MAG: hypothetical protein IKA34_03340 [Bacteroidales bacterium]|nr:hypothetical protein [Bacteroidales bacterium]